jgi:uncharacterized protein
LKSHPELSDGQISKLIGTTKPTIQAVRDRTHWNSPNIKPRHPVAVGLCTLQELEAAVSRANRGKKPVEVAAPTAEETAESYADSEDGTAA